MEAAEFDALIEVTRKQTRGLVRQLRSVSQLHAQLADALDERAAQPHSLKEAQRDEHPEDRST